MKKYVLLGELLTDYRAFKGISQGDFAAQMDVDVRTVQRWEKNESWIKPEKEELLVEVTFIPFQVIRNLNSDVSIPTFFDFRLRKYSLSALSNDLPKFEWLIDNMNAPENRIRPIDSDRDIETILRFSEPEYHMFSALDAKVIWKAVELLPELNVIIFDHSGFYSGHSVILPVSREIQIKMRDKVIQETDISTSDLVDPKTQSENYFHIYDINADCNENIFHIVGYGLRQYQANEKLKLVSSVSERDDNTHLTDKTGTQVIWEESDENGLIRKYMETDYRKMFERLNEESEPS